MRRRRKPGAPCQVWARQRRRIIRNQPGDATFPRFRSLSPRDTLKVSSAKRLHGSYAVLCVYQSCRQETYSGTSNIAWGWVTHPQAMLDFGEKSVSMPDKPYMVNGRVNDVANHMVNLNMTIDKRDHGAKGPPWLHEKSGLPNNIVKCCFVFAGFSSPCLAFDHATEHLPLSMYA